jgi:thiamine pyrophosphokinase
MEALLVTGGDAPPPERLAPRLGDFGLVCAADSGLDVLVDWGVEPDMIVGDMDSVSDPALVARFPRAKLLIEPRDKDFTDTELGLYALAEGGADRIVLAGGGGGRLDHLLAIRALFERAPERAWRAASGIYARQRPRPAEWHTAREVVYLVAEGTRLEVKAEPGSIVSVFPLAQGAQGMESEGLKWALRGLSWGPGDCGVSNLAPGGGFRVWAGKGDLLVALALSRPLPPGSGPGLGPGESRR